MRWGRQHDQNPVSIAEVWKQIGQEAERTRQHGEDPRRSETVGTLIGMLWRYRQVADSDSTYWLILPKRDEDPPYYYGFARLLRQQAPTLPMDPAARFERMVSALGESLRLDWEEMRSTEELFPTESLMKALWMAEKLQAADLHGLCCDLLSDVGERLISERDDSRRSLLIQLRGALQNCLMAFPPDSIPRFWERLRAGESRVQTPGTDQNPLRLVSDSSREFWPVLARMRDRRAVPFLLDVLPVLPEDGQAKVVTALQNIADGRALPALQALAADRESLLAPLAERAVMHILQHSKEDAALLLRSSAARHAGNAGATLLRPAAGTPRNAHDPDALLRPGEHPPEKEA